METKQLSRGLAAVLTISGMAIACGKPPPPKPPEPKPVVAVEPEVHERVVPHTCPAKTKLAQLMGHDKEQGPIEPMPPAAEAAPPPTTSVTSGSAKIPASQAYRVIAPATVLIRNDNGMGTGVVIDPKGYILTNNHVIADGRKTDFIVSVNVTFGEMTPTGRMQRVDKVYEAVVVKADVVRDLAIIKLKDPPAKLEVAKLAKSAPQVAEKVIAVGNAGIGFLWAAKSCSVASIGERQSDVSMLAAFDCSNVDPAMSKDEQESHKTRCDEAKKRLTEALNSSTQGLAIQTDCAITHGDSGGPLVNVSGELVGLNQSIAVDAATASFHVHLDEIRDFISKYPEEGTPIMPDPFCDGGFNPTLEDIDLDGKPDTLVNKGNTGLFGMFDKVSLLIDLDEDHYTKNTGFTDTFDAEIALLNNHEATYVWYDSDGDSKWDILLVDKDDDGKPDQMFHLDANGKPTEEKDKTLIPNHDFSAKFVKDEKLHGRLAKIATAVGGTKMVSAKTLAKAQATSSLPDPLLGGGNTGRAIDADYNGKADLAAVKGTFSRGFLLDADEDTLGSTKGGTQIDDLVKNKKIDPEVSLVMQGTSLWAYYDTNNDSKFDLVLTSTAANDTSSLFATGAFKLDAKGEQTPAPENIGRRILRPGLIPSLSRLAPEFRYFSSDVASDEALGSLPDPTVTRGHFRAQEVKTVATNSILDADYGLTSVTLIDVDHDTKIPAKDADLDKIAKDGKFDAEVALVHRGYSSDGIDWIFYDTDNDGNWDLVLFVPQGTTDPKGAFSLTKEKVETPKPDPKAAKDAPKPKPKMTLAYDASQATGRPMKYKVFKDKALGAKWKAIALKMFKASSVEE